MNGIRGIESRDLGQGAGPSRATIWFNDTGPVVTYQKQAGDTEADFLAGLLAHAELVGRLEDLGPIYVHINRDGTVTVGTGLLNPVERGDCWGEDTPDG